jgi:hypothetical protein
MLRTTTGSTSRHGILTRMAFAPPELHALLVYLTYVLRGLSALLIAIGVFDLNAPQILYGLVAFHIGVWFAADLSE